MVLIANPNMEVDIGEIFELMAELLSVTPKEMEVINLQNNVQLKPQ